MTDTLASVTSPSTGTAQGPRRNTVPPAGAGFPLVLTADRMLMARYRTLFDGMVSAGQTTRTPGFLMKLLLAPRPGRTGVRAGLAPLGLRRVEAALRGGGRSRDEVAVVAPWHLEQAIGPETRVIGLASGDPLGVGMNSTTMSGITGGEIYTSRWFRSLAERVRELRRNAPSARVVMGGPGAWQLAGNDRARRALGVDHVVTGYCEGNVGELFDRLAAGEELPVLLPGRDVEAEDIPAIAGPTVMGVVETSRGCGWGCDFCTISETPMRHLPVETVCRDLETNLAAGVTNMSLISEDVFRYGGAGPAVNPGALVELLHRVRSLSGLGLLQPDHANITSVARFSDAELREVHRLLVGPQRHDFVWINLGVETASGELLAANGGRAKMHPYGSEAWSEVCLEQVRRLAAAGFFPLVSLVMGLAGETPEDVQRTLRWVRELRDERVAVFPMFCAPVEAGRPAFGVAEMSAAHWQLLRESYRLNFRWIPRLCWDNQRGAGVGVLRRVLLQVLGRTNVLWWKGLFAWRSGRAFS